MKKVIILLLACLLVQCASSRFKLPRKELKIAVLPFTARGPGISQKTGYIAADKFSTLLFVNKKIPVVDRSQVNYALYAQGIENVYFLSKENLICLADTLQASVLALGLIENYAKKKEFQFYRNKVTITLRFLKGSTGETLSIVYHTQENKKPPMEILEEMLTELVEKL